MSGPAPQAWRVVDVTVTRVEEMVVADIRDRSSFADSDPLGAAGTRHAFVEPYADTGTLVLGTHRAPTGGYLRRDGRTCVLTADA